MSGFVRHMGLTHGPDGQVSLGPDGDIDCPIFSMAHLTEEKTEAQRGQKHLMYLAPAPCPCCCRPVRLCSASHTGAQCLEPGLQAESAPASVDTRDPRGPEGQWGLQKGEWAGAP